MQRQVSLFVFTFALGCSTSGPLATTEGSNHVPGAATSAGFAWTEVTPCPLARFEANGVAVEGEVWVMGGFIATSLDVTRRVDIYNPDTDSWRSGTELPGAETHVGVATVGSDLLLAGGFVGNVDARATTAGTWRWSAANKTWTAGPDLPSRRAAVASALIGTEFHAAGGLAEDGNTDSGDHVVWNIDSQDGWKSAEALPNPRNHGGGAASGGRFFAVAGRHGWDEVAGHDVAVHAFDPATGTWAARASIPGARSEINAATVAMSDGRLLVIGGSVAGMQPSSDVLLYDPRADAWSALPSLPLALKGAVAARVGPKIIVSTGSPTSIDPSATTYVGCCL